MDFFKKYPCAIPLLFLLAYGIPILALVPYFSFQLQYLSRLLGLIAMLNVFTQVMLGTFRKFFNNYYKPAKVFKFHNTLGVITLIIVLVHAIIMPDVINSLLLNSNLGVNLGTIALYIMSITVLSSDLKYFLKINYSTKTWRLIHILNYSLLPILFFHAINLSLTLRNPIVYYLFIVYLALTIVGIIKKIKMFYTK